MVRRPLPILLFSFYVYLRSQHWMQWFLTSLTYLSHRFVTWSGTRSNLALLEKLDSNGLTQLSQNLQISKHYDLSTISCSFTVFFRQQTWSARLLASRFWHPPSSFCQILKVLKASVEQACVPQWLAALTREAGHCSRWRTQRVQATGSWKVHSGTTNVPCRGG